MDKAEAVKFFPDVDPEVVKEFFDLRRIKKMGNGPIAMRLFKENAAECGISTQAAMELCLVRGWGSFRADWISEESISNFVSSKSKKNPDNEENWL